MSMYVVSPAKSFDARESFVILVFIEAAALGTLATQLLWNRLPHNLLAFLTGVVVWALYFFPLKMEATMYWMLVPRMLMWGMWVGMLSTISDFHADGVWAVFVGCFPAALIWWNVHLAKGVIKWTKECDAKLATALSKGA